MDDLASLNCMDHSQVTGSAWGAIGKALKLILEVCPDVTTMEIQRRAANYRLHMPDAMITPSALAKHWATCDHPPKSVPVQTESVREYTPFAS